jgi:hypothetical protein
MNYKKWLYSEEVKDLKYYQNIILSKLDLDYQGLNKSISTWDSEFIITKLNELGEYKNLTQNKRKRAEMQIRSKVGTLGDIAKILV